MPTRPPVHRPRHGSAAETAKAYDAWRGSPESRGYDAAWRKVRASHLRTEPLCRFCRAAGLLVPAEVVDHIEPIAARPDLRLDMTNLRSLCASHRDSLTATQMAAGHGGMVARRGR
jgi:5-methylcytosine-specific restriction endonuclease McrA